MNSTQGNQLIFINSLEALQGNEADTFYFENPMTANRGNKMYCELKEATIPVSFYTINAFNDLLVLSVNNSQVSIQLTHQNYNINQLISEINAKFSSNSSFNLTASFNFQTNKIKLSLTSSSNFTSLSIHESTTCLKIVGFVKSQSGSVNNLTAEITGENVVNLSRTMNIFVRTNMKLNNINAKGDLNSTIAKIQVNKKSGEIIHYHNIEGVKFMLSNRYLDHLEIVLEDDEHNKIDFNGLEYHLTFAIFYAKEQLQEYVNTFSDKVKELQENNTDTDTDSD